MSPDSITPDQRDKESAIFWAIVLDSVLVNFFIFVGIFSGSMTFISELLRCALLLSIEYVSYIVLRRTHRGKFQAFEFGTGKIERIVNLLVAFGLCIACLYIFTKLISPGEGVPMSSSNLILAVFAADLNLILNVYFTIAFMKVNTQESSVIISSQIKSRLAKTIASAIVLGILILTLWLPDPESARIVDTLGSLFVLCYMLVTAFDLVRESLPEILDRTVAEPDHYQILRVLTTHFDQYDGFKGYRTRRSGKDLFILINLCYFATTPLALIETRLNPIRKAMESQFPGSKVTIVPEIMDE
jgi:cation diffusion facilitator family transporter